MARHPFHDVAIVGAYHTRQAKVLEGVRELDLVLDAVRGALASANLRPADVDGVNVRSTVWRLNPREAGGVVRRAAGVDGRSLGIEGVIEAALAIATGQCETVVMADAQAGEYTDHASTSPWTRPTNEFVASWGLYTAAEFALIARRHMHLYGTRPESLAEVAATIRNHGARTPTPVFYGRHVTRTNVLCVAHGRRSLSPARLRDQLRGRRRARAHHRRARGRSRRPADLPARRRDRAPGHGLRHRAGLGPLRLERPPRRADLVRAVRPRPPTSTCASSTTRSRSS
jgi:hypothetical protein